jgi:hypothetical protein
MKAGFAFGFARGFRKIGLGTITGIFVTICSTLGDPAGTARGAFFFCIAMITTSWF